MKGHCAVCSRDIGLSSSTERDSQLDEHRYAGQRCPGSRRSVVGAQVIADRGAGVVIPFPVGRAA